MNDEYDYYRSLMKKAQFYPQEHFVKEDPKIIENLFDPSSQTKKYVKAFGEMNLKLIAHHWVDNKKIFLREVLLSAHNQSLLFAQTLVPHTTIKQFPDFLNLGKTPLGIWLFEKHNATRTIEVAFEDGYFLRKSCFDVDGFDVSLFEVFIV